MVIFERDRGFFVGEKSLKEHIISEIQEWSSGGEEEEANVL